MKKQFLCVGGFLDGKFAEWGEYTKKAGYTLFNNSCGQTTKREIIRGDDFQPSAILINDYVFAVAFNQYVDSVKEKYKKLKEREVEKRAVVYCKSLPPLRSAQPCILVKGHKRSHLGIFNERFNLVWDNYDDYEFEKVGVLK